MRTAVAVSACLALLRGAFGADVISTNGFSSCGSADSSIQVQNLDISFDRATNKITFNVAGKSDVEQDVTASIIVQAYGMDIYNQTFDPCAEDTKVDQLCPSEPAPITRHLSMLTSFKFLLDSSQQSATRRFPANMPRKFLQSPTVSPTSTAWRRWFCKGRMALRLPV